MFKWIEDHMGFLFLCFGVIVIIEIAIGAWRLPKEFRSSIIPKMQKVAAYEQRVKIHHSNQDELILNNQQRINFLMGIEQRRMLWEKK